jgi:hypothetical protein
MLPGSDEDNQNGSIWKNKNLKWVQCVLPSERKDSQWILNERNFIQRHFKQLMKSHEKNDMVFLIAIFNKEHVVEMSSIYLGKPFSR